MGVYFIIYAEKARQSATHCEIQPIQTQLTRFIMIDKEKLLEGLERGVDKSRWGAACSAGANNRARAMSLSDEIYDTYKGSVFGWFDGKVYCFNGRIYEECPMELFKWCLVELLRRAAVDSGIRSYYSLISERALACVRIENELKPSFSIHAFVNGVVDFEEGVLHEFAPKWPVLSQHDYAFEPKADCPTWKAFLHQVLPERNSRLTLQMFLGLTTMDRRKFKKPVENCLALYGNRNNGRGVINDVIRGIFGSESISTLSLERLLDDSDKGALARSALLGKSINFSGDVSESVILAHEDEFRRYISGCDVTARLTRGATFALTNVPWQVFNFNEIPSYDGHTVFSRFLYLLFCEVIPEDMQNPMIAKELEKEYPGILNWILKGARYLRVHGYKFPKSDNAAREKLLCVGEADSMLAWMMLLKLSVHPRVSGEEFRWVMSNELYKHYSAFCDENGFEKITIVAFGSRLRGFGFRGQYKMRTAKGNKYKVYGYSRDVEKGEPINLEEWKLSVDAEFNDIPE